MITLKNVNSRVVAEYLLKSSGAGDRSMLTDEEFTRSMTTFGSKHPHNPAVVWLGYSPRDKRPARSWKHVAGIHVKTVFSQGLNPKWQTELRSVGGNLYRFVTECQAAYGHEYSADRLAPSELSLIIGVVHAPDSGEVELLDGSHRLAALILAGRSEVEGYIGFY